MAMTRPAVLQNSYRDCRARLRFFKRNSNWSDSKIATAAGIGDGCRASINKFVNDKVDGWSDHTLSRYIDLIDKFLAPRVVDDDIVARQVRTADDIEHLYSLNPVAGRSVGRIVERAAHFHMLLARKVLTQPELCPPIGLLDALAGADIAMGLPEAVRDLGIRRSLLAIASQVDKSESKNADDSLLRESPELVVNLVSEGVRITSILRDNAAEESHHMIQGIGGYTLCYLGMLLGKWDLISVGQKWLGLALRSKHRPESGHVENSLKFAADIVRYSGPDGVETAKQILDEIVDSNIWFVAQAVNDSETKGLRGYFRCHRLFQ